MSDGVMKAEAGFQEWFRDQLRKQKRSLARKLHHGSKKVAKSFG
jgi:hypothetical protein